MSVSRRINYYCPDCQSEDLERVFAHSKELWGWSWHCAACDWRGQHALVLWCSDSEGAHAQTKD